MKTSLLILFSVICAINTLTQNNLTKRFNGTYYLMQPEKGINNKPTKTKIVEFGNNNGTKILAIAACKKCVPAIYTYQVKESKKYNSPIFFNTFGLYVLPYDKDSFIIVQITSKLGSGKWNKFAFSNFYSKNKNKVSQMSKQTIEEYAITFSNQ